MRAAIVTAIVGIVLVGCEHGVMGPPGIPVAWSDVGLIATDRESEVLGFTLHNRSSIEIARVELRFVLGGDAYECAAAGPIAAGGDARYELGLDEVPAAARNATLERFHPHVVHFTDGSRWYNPGVHLAGAAPDPSGSIAP